MAESLSAVDTAWLRMEDPTNLMMVTGVLQVRGRLTVAEFRALVTERLLCHARFRSRVVESALGLAPPRWTEDPHFDLAAHVHRTALPAPGGRAELEDLVSDLMSTPLDMSRPLWQFHLVEGLAGGGTALLARLHHCIADGIALIRLLLSLTGEPALLEARPDAGPAAERTWVLPTAVTDLVAGREPIIAAAAGVRRVGGALAELTLLPADQPTLLKGPLGVSKRAAWTDDMPLAPIKAYGRRARATINDVLVAGVTEALREYLIERGEDMESLDVRAAIPVNLRPPDPLGERPLVLGNQFGLVFLDLPVGEADRGARLALLKERMDALKASPQAVVARGLLGAIGRLPRALHPPVVEFFGTKATLVLTNVPGPREKLSLAGHRVEGAMFWVPQSGRLGLGVSVLSYAGSVRVGFAADARLVPDPQRLARLLEAALRSVTAPRTRTRVRAST